MIPLRGLCNNGFACVGCAIALAVELRSHPSHYNVSACGGNSDGEGFEPSLPFGKHAFQACAIDHSATHPFFWRPVFLNGAEGFDNSGDEDCFQLIGRVVFSEAGDGG